MRHAYHCPNCAGTMRRTGHGVRTLDFFCAACRLAVSIVDDHWVQVMRPTDLARQTVPMMRVLPCATGPLDNPNGSGPLAC